jgi:hypothetical protein
MTLPVRRDRTEEDRKEERRAAEKTSAKVEKESREVESRSEQKTMIWRPKEETQGEEQGSGKWWSKWDLEPERDDRRKGKGRKEKAEWKRSEPVEAATRTEMWQ